MWPHPAHGEAVAESWRPLRPGTGFRDTLALPQPVPHRPCLSWESSAPRSPLPAGCPGIEGWGWEGAGVAPRCRPPCTAFLCGEGPPRGCQVCLLFRVQSLRHLCSGGRRLATERLLATCCRTSRREQSDDAAATRPVAPPSPVGTRPAHCLSAPAKVLGLQSSVHHPLHIRGTELGTTFSPETPQGHPTAQGKTRGGASLVTSALRAQTCPAGAAGWGGPTSALPSPPPGPSPVTLSSAASQPAPPSLSCRRAMSKVRAKCLRRPGLVPSRGALGKLLA